MTHDGFGPHLLGPLMTAFLAGYLLGGVPFGVLITRAMGLGDLRKIGSGNIGATNVLRAGHRGAALATLVMDMLKGAAPTLLALAWLGPLGAGAAGLGAFLGHCFPIWLWFRGGKGVATGFGVLLAWSWPVGLMVGGFWLAAALITRRSSVGALAAALAAPALLALKAWDYGPQALVMTAVLIWRHWANIGRLLRGEEPEISLGRSERSGP